jgi:hypothetical protein
MLRGRSEPFVLQKRFIGGLIKKAGDFFFGKITTRVKNFLRDHGDEQITSLKVGRTPISKALDTAINLISGGSFDEDKKKEGYDKFYHTFIIINDKYRLEKNQTVNTEPYKKADNEENEVVKAPTKSINEFIQQGVDKVGEDNFWGNYQALSQNCQWFLKNLLNANGITSADKFIYQDVKNIKDDLKQTNIIANETTDLASGIDKLVSWISNGKMGLKHGGKVKDIKGLRKRKMF